MTRTLMWLLVALIACAPTLTAQDDHTHTPPELAHDHQTAAGNLAIRAVQGTAGGPTLAGKDIQVYLFHNGKQFQKIDGTLDDMGLLVLSGLPVATGIRPLVRIEHGGVTYQDTGEEMTPANPDVAVEVVVYETTTTKPAWRVVSRQAIVTPDIGRLLISESVYVDNPNDKTWLGGEEASNGKLTTVELGLPENTENITLHAGFHDWCCTTFEDGTLGVQMPLMPGRYVYQYMYEVPTTGGVGRIALRAEAVTDELAIIIPESGIMAEPDGLSPGSVQMTESGPQRLYLGHGFAADQTPSLTLTGLVQTTPITDPDVSPEQTPAGGSPAMIWIGGGVAAVGLLGLVATFILKRRPDG